MSAPTCSRTRCAAGLSASIQSSRIKSPRSGIWQPSRPSWSGREDLSDLAGRFNTFVGLAERRPVIENGLRRLALPVLHTAPQASVLPIDLLDAEIRECNEEMFRRQEEHGALKARWMEAIDAGSEGRVLPEVMADRPPGVREFLLEKTLRHLLYVAMSIFAAGFNLVWQFAEAAPSGRALLWMLAASGAVGLVVSAPLFVRSLWLWLRHLPVDGSVRQIAEALLDAFCEHGLIRGAGPGRPDLLLTAVSDSRPGMSVNALEDGRVSIALTGASLFDQELFADALAELFGPIDNPRYLLVRQTSRRLGARVDYHAVPEILATKQARAQSFSEAWQRRVGPASLLNTRTTEGRKLLLQARARAFSAALANRTERRDRWQ